MHEICGQHCSPGTCSAADLIKVLSAALTWAPRSGSSPDVQKFHQPCHQPFCVITSPCNPPPSKQNAFCNRIWGWRGKKDSGGEIIVGVFFHFSLGLCGYNFRCGNEGLHAELIWGKGQPCAREVVVSMGGAQRVPWHLFFFALFPFFVPLTALSLSPSLCTYEDSELLPSHCRNAHYKYPL